MDTAFWEATGWSLPETLEMVRMISRLVSAALLGALIGGEREWHGMEAGLRTHMLVALGAALFTFVPLEAGGGTQEIAAIVRGIAPGIGFIGAGAILKLAAEREIKGLTTAGSVWLTAAVGYSAGAGFMWSALVAALISLFVLIVLGWFESAFPRRTRKLENDTRTLDK